ncbi:uncharacterized protein LOC127705527 [Mytilus californianus]|uniref:uncharacterized protein LOC127705527 n=1 Tax=Mytilus californianus TaxID=6549 RepID=UPI0022455CC7|nr:uncharacterized protein LOC127705527 [Mytilus californianus]
MKAIVRIILRMLFAIYFVNSVLGNDICKKSICLDWELDVNKFTLTCRITNIHLRVFIDDPYGKTQAVCLPPYPFVCEAYYKNGSMSYSTITKEIKFILNGETGRKVEGFWACRHGTGRDISSVFVSMITTTGSKSTLIVNSTDKRTDTISTPTQTSSAWSSKLMEFKNYSDLTVNEGFQSTQFMYTDMEREKTNVKLGTIISKFYGLFIGAAVLVLIMFVVCSIWISRRFTDIQLKLDARVQNHLNQTEEHTMDLNENTDERIDRMSDYDSINENEMLPFSSVVVFGDKDSSLDTDNIATTHTCIHENTSSSDNSYLEVIDDSTYLNPYQSIEVQHDSKIDHDYCTTSGSNFLEMCSPKLTEKSSNEQSSTCYTDVSNNHGKFDVTVQSESPEINVICSEILKEKTLFTVKPDNNEANDACIFPSHSMSTLL